MIENIHTVFFVRHREDGIYKIPNHVGDTVRIIGKEQEKKMNLSINPEGPFQVHMLNESGKLKAASLAAAFNQLLNVVYNINRPDQTKARPTLQDPAATGYPAVNNLEMTQCILKLQEASFYAKRAMAVLPENQQ